MGIESHRRGSPLFSAMAVEFRHIVRATVIPLEKQVAHIDARVTSTERTVQTVSNDVMTLKKTVRRSWGRANQAEAQAALVG